MAVEHTIRSGKDLEGKLLKTVSLTPTTAVRAFCRECMGFSAKEVELCTAPLCPLFPFRNAKLKHRAGPKNLAGVTAINAARALQGTRSNAQD